MTSLEDFKIKDENTDDLSDTNNIAKFLYRDGLQQILHVSDEMLQEYYLAALSVLEQKRYQDASDAFVFLTALNGDIYNFWQALGIAEQSLGHFENAASAYTMAESLEPENPEPTANLYQCLAAAGAEELAQVYLKQAIEYCNDNPEYAELKAKLLTLQKEDKNVRI